MNTLTLTASNTTGGELFHPEPALEEKRFLHLNSQFVDAINALSCAYQEISHTLPSRISLNLFRKPKDKGARVRQAAQLASVGKRYRPIQRSIPIRRDAGNLIRLSHEWS